MNGNMLEGNSSIELGDCISLTTLDLGNNKLNGFISDKSVELSELWCLVLSHNNLLGSIPSTKSLYFRQLTVPHLDLSYNVLSGELPSIISSVQSLVGKLVSSDVAIGFPFGAKFQNNSKRVE